MNISNPTISQLPALRRLWQEAFGDTDAFLDIFFSTAFSPERCRCTTVGDNVTAALYWFDCLHLGKPVAYLYAVATDKAFRGQGICHKLMSNTHEHLKKLGYQGVILVPGSDKLFLFYESMNYHTCSQIREFNCTGTAMDISLHSIDKDEYAKLRRQLLPKGGIVQENENMDFLQTQAKFYSGTDFILAAHGEGDTLLGVELLGDDTLASGIVHALGYTKGSFRTPGQGTPFAMYHSLTDNTFPPAYFGLAFD